jgi:hypothetical protein
MEYVTLIRPASAMLDIISTQLLKNVSLLVMDNQVHNAMGQIYLHALIVLVELVTMELATAGLVLLVIPAQHKHL